MRWWPSRYTVQRPDELIRTDVKRGPNSHRATPAGTPAPHLIRLTVWAGPQRVRDDLAPLRSTKVFFRNNSAQWDINHLAHVCYKLLTAIDAQCWCILLPNK
jgi:hypothetical protein